MHIIQKALHSDYLEFGYVDGKITYLSDRTNELFCYSDDEIQNADFRK